MPKGVAAIIFFFAWLICGCGVETMLDHPASGGNYISGADSCDCMRQCTDTKIGVTGKYQFPRTPSNI